MDSPAELDKKLGISHLVRIGLLGSVGQFRAEDGRCYRRNEEVVCRTDRGLETGIVVCPLDEQDRKPQNDGQLLRTLTPEDHLIVRRIDRFRDRAFAACTRLIDESGLHAVLVDVEHLFDGQSLYFYFLGDVSDEVHQLTASLAEAYEKKVRFRKFTETMAKGCGPNCGTEGSGCSGDGLRQLRIEWLLRNKKQIRLADLIAGKFGIMEFKGITDCRDATRSI